MTAIGVAVIGCGDIAHARYLPAIAKSPDFELRGVFNRTRAAGDVVVGRYGGTNHVRLEDLLRAPDIDAVVIATPHPSHVDLAVLSLEAGKHVLCEKPMATSVVDAMRIEEAAGRSGRVYMALPFDNSPAVEEAKRLIETNAIGRVQHGRRSARASRSQTRTLVLRRGKGALGRAGGSGGVPHQSVDLSVRAGHDCARQGRYDFSRTPRRGGRKSSRRRSTTTPPPFSNFRAASWERFGQTGARRRTIATSSAKPGSTARAA